MRISILTVGSRGDVQPYIALGKGLAASGHEVSVATHQKFQSFVQEHGLLHTPVTGDVRQILESEQVSQALAKGGNPITFYRRLREACAPLVEQGIRDCLAACENADYIFLTPYTIYIGYYIAREFNLPFGVGCLHPAGPTRHHHNVLLPPAPKWLPGKSLYHIVSHLIVSQLIWTLQRPLLNDGIKRVGGSKGFGRIEPLSLAFTKQKPPMLYAYSPAVLSKPKDWVDYQHVTGYWFLDAEKETLAPELEDFISSGKPPVYVGFGSMNHPEDGNIPQIVKDLRNRSKQRLVVLADKENMLSLQNEADIFLIKSAPFDLLFERMAAVVHHGGVGTTALGLRAGTPSVITTFIPEQRFWAYWVHKTGATSKPIPRKGLTVNKLSTALNRVINDKKVRNCAQTISKKIKNESGVHNAVQIINRQLEYKKTIAVHH